MEIKGTIFLSRKNIISKLFGLEKWEKFLEELSEKDNFFKQNITQSTTIPITSFLLFDEAILKTFFDNNKENYILIGEESAKWYLNEGPYGIYVKQENIEKFFIEILPRIWNTHYSGIKIETTINREKNEIFVRLTNISYNMIQLELVSLGFIKKTLEMMGFKDVIFEKLKGLTNGDKEIYYKFNINFNKKIM